MNNLRERITEGYFPKIVRSLNNRSYPGRPNDLVLQDINREDEHVEIAELERWRDRIFQAIDQGYVVEQGTNRQIPLDEQSGIDILGNLLECSALTPNRQLYGRYRIVTTRLYRLNLNIFNGMFMFLSLSLHNMGHNLIAYVHDPDNRHLEDYGVMADVATAMRDPIFYRWHAFIESIFVKFKNQLQPYQTHDLRFDGINVTTINVRIMTRASSVPPNSLITYWQKSDVDLGAGLDFGPGNVYAQVRRFLLVSFGCTSFYFMIISLFFLFIFSSLIYSMRHLNIK